MSKFAIAYHERLGLWSRVSCNTAVYADMLSRQYGNTFNFNFLILYQCYWKSKTCFEKFISKPSRGHLDFDFFQKIRLFFRVDKKRNKTEKIFGSMPPPNFKMSQDFVFSDSCTRVHGILSLLQIHVSTPGTWNFVFSSNSCTKVQESEKTKSWDILKKGGWGMVPKKCFVLCRP